MVGAIEKKFNVSFWQLKLVNIDFRINVNIKTFKITELIANIKLNCYSLCIVLVEIEKDMAFLGKEPIRNSTNSFSQLTEKQ